MRPHPFETMRAEGGRVCRLEAHLARHARACGAFGFAFSARAARAAVARALAEAEPAAVHRVRLVAAEEPLASAEPFAEPPLRTVWLCPEPLLEAGGPLCLHKTTARAHYDRPLAQARARGADEALLVDVAGELVEGTRTTLWLRLGGRWLTPRAEAGGLPGVHRAHVLATRADAAEARLAPHDLERADAVVVANALRGASNVRVVS